MQTFHEDNTEDIRRSEDKMEDMEKRMEDLRNRRENEFISDDEKQKLELDMAELKVDIQKEKMKLKDFRDEDKEDKQRAKESTDQDIVSAISEAIEDLKSFNK